MSNMHDSYRSSTKLKMKSRILQLRIHKNGEERYYGRDLQERDEERDRCGERERSEWRKRGFAELQLLGEGV